jgi:bacillithiol biosynthesis cysteine-adding enzyme BshC
VNSTEYFPFDKIPAFSKLDKAYASQRVGLKSFYQFEPDPDGIRLATQMRRQYPVNRTLLHETLTTQYQNLSISPLLQSNLDAILEENTFTLITAHQPCLFLGPLFTVYKILSTIKLSQMLNAEQSDYKYIPTFILGAEDHDVEEVNHIHLFNKKIVWETNQTGSCGRFNLDGLEEVIGNLKETLGGSANAESILNRVQNAYSGYRTYGQATRIFIHDLFNEYGLVILDMDDSRLKNEFKSVIQDEIMNETALQNIITTQEEISNLGYKPATFVRPINFFYLGNGYRERIEREAENFRLQQSGQLFTPEEMSVEIDTAPENFSPNVNVRPVYQEFTLPNVAYIGGGGELAYWLERKNHFAALNVFYPVLIRRDSVMLIESGVAAKMEKVALSTDIYFSDIDEIISYYLENILKDHVEIDQERAAIESLLDLIVTKGSKADVTLKAAFEAEKVRVLKTLEGLEGRIKRAEKQNNEVKINQLRQVKDKMFPDQQLQERHENFMSYYLKYGSGFFDIILDHLDPLRSELKIIRLEG